MMSSYRAGGCRILEGRRTCGGALHRQWVLRPRVPESDLKDLSLLGDPLLVPQYMESQCPVPELSVQSMTPGSPPFLSCQSKLTQCPLSREFL